MKSIKTVREQRDIFLEQLTTAQAEIVKFKEDIEVLKRNNKELADQRFEFMSKITEFEYELKEAKKLIEFYEGEK